MSHLARGVCCGLLMCGMLAGCDGALDALVLRPDGNIRMTPADFDYQASKLDLPHKGEGHISIWHVPTTVERKGILVVVPGNDANKGRYTPGLPLFVDHGWDVILMDYEGYGESSGTATFDGLFASARTVLDYAFGQSDVVVGYSFSMGSPVLTRMAADYDFTAVIFESYLDFWRESTLFAERHLGAGEFFGFADAIAMAGSGEDFDARRWIAQVQEPKLFIHSPQDSITPFDGAWDVYEASPAPKHFFVTEGDHANQLFLDPVLYRSVVNGWLDGVLQRDPVLNERFQQVLQEELQYSLGVFGLPQP